MPRFADLVYHAANTGSNNQHASMEMHEELFRDRIAVVDKNNEPTGEIKQRLQIHSDGDWHRITAIYIVNRDGHILCHRRADTSERSPGQWQPYVGGHILHNEIPVQGAVRELHEELGLNVRPQELKAGPMRKSEKISAWTYTFVYRFTGRMEDLHFLDQEVSEVTFLPYARIFQSLEQENGRWAARVSSLEAMKLVLGC